MVESVVWIRLHEKVAHRIVIALTGLKTKRNETEREGIRE